MPSEYSTHIYVFIQDPHLHYWGGYDTVPNLLLNAAVYSGTTYVAGSLYLRFSNRVRWGVAKPNFRRRRMVLALASGIFGTRVGIQARTEEVADVIPEIPFLSAPCLNLLYYPSIISRRSDKELNAQIAEMRNDHKAAGGEQGSQSTVDTETAVIEGMYIMHCLMCTKELISDAQASQIRYSVWSATHGPHLRPEQCSMTCYDLSYVNSCGLTHLKETWSLA